jgi:hypothetical protein
METGAERGFRRNAGALGKLWSFVSLVVWSKNSISLKTQNNWLSLIKIASVRRINNLQLSIQMSDQLARVMFSCNR